MPYVECPPGLSGRCWEFDTPGFDHATLAEDLQWAGRFPNLGGGPTDETAAADMQAITAAIDAGFYDSPVNWWELFIPTSAPEVLCGRQGWVRYGRPEWNFWGAFVGRGFSSSAMQAAMDDCDEQYGTSIAEDFGLSFSDNPVDWVNLYLECQDPIAGDSTSQAEFDACHNAMVDALMSPEELEAERVAALGDDGGPPVGLDDDEGTALVAALGFGALLLAAAFKAKGRR